MKTLRVKFQGRFNNFSRTVCKDSEEILKKVRGNFNKIFLTLEMYEKFVGKLCNFFLQFENPDNFERLENTLSEHRANSGKIFNYCLHKFNKSGLF